MGHITAVMPVTCRCHCCCCLGRGCRPGGSAGGDGWLGTRSTGGGEWSAQGGVSVVQRHTPVRPHPAPPLPVLTIPPHLTAGDGGRGGRGCGHFGVPWLDLAEMDMFIRLAMASQTGCPNYHMHIVWVLGSRCFDPTTLPYPASLSNSHKIQAAYGHTLATSQMPMCMDTQLQC